MKLYDYFRSSAAYRVRIALNLKGVEADERTFVHLRMGNQRAQDYLALNPQGLVPAFELDDFILNRIRHRSPPGGKADDDRRTGKRERAVQFVSSQVRRASRAAKSTPGCFSSH